MRVLVLTGLPLNPALVHEVADSGAAGLLPKSTSLGVVVETIPALGGHTLRRGSPEPDRACARARAARPSAAAATRHPLTRRERDILVAARQRGRSPGAPPAGWASP